MEVFLADKTQEG